MIRFNIKNAKKCLANTKRNKTPCQASAMKNCRCRLHGGKSTGARTKKGLRKLKEINYKNGCYTQEGIAYRKLARRYLTLLDAILSLGLVKLK
jgi:hypothetical protein